MYDGKIIAACIEDGKAYNEIREHVSPDEFTPTGSFWWKQIQNWYARDPDARAIDLSLLRDRGEREAGRNAEIVGEYLETLPEAPSPDNVAWELLELKRNIKYRELAAAMEAEYDREEVMRLTQEHYDLMVASGLNEEIEYADINSVDLRDPENLVPLFPNQLNDRTGGGAERGTHIVVFARVEAGKTLFAVNMVAGWLRTGRRVLYLGNEEPVERIAGRIRSNLSGLNVEQQAAYPDVMWERCNRKGYQNLRMAQITPGTPEVVESYVKDFKPDCLVIDQLRNLHTSSGRSGTRAQALDRVASSIRQLTNTHQLVTLSLGQANAGEHGKPRIWFEADDFDESRTGVPASADLMIALGFDHKLDAHNQRAVSVCKNKLSGDHEGFIVTIDKKRSIVK